MPWFSSMSLTPGVSRFRGGPWGMGTYLDIVAHIGTQLLSLSPTSQKKRRDEGRLCRLNEPHNQEAKSVPVILKDYLRDGNDDAKRRRTDGRIG